MSTGGTDTFPSATSDGETLCLLVMLLIGAYLGMNNLMTSVFDELGFNALTTLFACLTAGNLFAPSVIARTGARTALLIGAGCHCTINVVAAVAACASMSPRQVRAKLEQLASVVRDDFWRFWSIFGQIFGI